MKITANYAYRNNYDSYSVTMDLGDVPMGQADITVDDLLTLGREAIQRQLNAQPKPEKCCNFCSGPISPRQKHIIIKLARARVEFIDLEGMTIHQASDLIERLMSNAV